MNYQTPDARKLRLAEYIGELCTKGSVNGIIDGMLSHYADNYIEFANALTPTTLSKLLATHISGVERGQVPQVSRLKKRLEEERESVTQIARHWDFNPDYIAHVNELINGVNWAEHEARAKEAFQPYARFGVIFGIFKQLARTYITHTYTANRCTAKLTTSLTESSEASALALERSVRWALDNNLGLMQGTMPIRKITYTKGTVKVRMYGISNELPQDTPQLIGQHFTLPFGFHQIGIPEGEQILTSEEEREFANQL